MYKPVALEWLPAQRTCVHSWTANTRALHSDSRPGPSTDQICSHSEKKQACSPEHIRIEQRGKGRPPFFREGAPGCEKDRRSDVDLDPLSSKHLQIQYRYYIPYLNTPKSRWFNPINSHFPFSGINSHSQCECSLFYFMCGLCIRLLYSPFRFWMLDILLLSMWHQHQLSWRWAWCANLLSSTTVFNAVCFTVTMYIFCPQQTLGVWHQNKVSEQFQKYSNTVSTGKQYSTIYKFKKPELSFSTLLSSLLASYISYNSSNNWLPIWSKNDWLMGYYDSVCINFLVKSWLI